MGIPTIRTERPILRPMRAGDWPDCAALMALAGVVRDAGARRPDPEDLVFRHPL